MKHRQGQKNKFTYSFLRRFYLAAGVARLAAGAVRLHPVQRGTEALFGPTFTSGARACAEGADA